MDCESSTPQGVTLISGATELQRQSAVPVLSATSIDYRQRGPIQESCLVGTTAPWMTRSTMADPVFALGSVAKSVTGLLFAQAFAHRTLSADRTLASLVPCGPLGTATLGQILTHTGGIPAEVSPLLWHVGTGPTRAELASFCQTSDPIGPPGAAFHYSNAGYGLLGYVLEEVFGSTWSELAAAAITATGVTGLTIARPDSVIRGTWSEPDSGHTEAERELTFDALAPAGQIWGTAGAIASWVATLAGITGSVSESITSTLTTSAVPIGQRTHYGFGVTVDDRHHGPALMIGGLIPGYRCAATAASHLRRAAAVCVNSGSAPPLDKLATSMTLLDGAADACHIAVAGWSPPVVPLGVRSVTGNWFIDRTPITVQWTGVELTVRTGLSTAAPVAARLRPVGQNSYLTTAGWNAGEILTVAVDQVQWAGYPLRRQLGSLLAG